MGLLDLLRGTPGPSAADGFHAPPPTSHDGAIAGW